MHATHCGYDARKILNKFESVRRKQEDHLKIQINTLTKYKNETAPDSGDSNQIQDIKTLVTTSQNKWCYRSFNENSEKTKRKHFKELKTEINVFFKKANQNKTTKCIFRRMLPF